MSRKTTIHLTGDALTAARAVHGIHQQAHAQKAELCEWVLDASYLEDHGCAFLNKREEEEGARPSLGDLLQSMTASKH